MHIQIHNFRISKEKKFFQPLKPIKKKNACNKRNLIDLFYSIM